MGGPFFMILKQISAKLKHELYRLNIPTLKKAMLIGTDTTGLSNNSLFGLCASTNAFQT